MDKNYYCEALNLDGYECEVRAEVLCGGGGSTGRLKGCLQPLCDDHRISIGFDDYCFACSARILDMKVAA